MNACTAKILELLLSIHTIFGKGLQGSSLLFSSVVLAPQRCVIMYRRGYACLVVLLVLSVAGFWQQEAANLMLSTFILESIHSRSLGCDALSCYCLFGVSLSEHIIAISRFGVACGRVTRLTRCIFLESIADFEILSRGAK